MLGQTSQTSARGGLIVTDYRDIIKELRKIETGLPKALRAEIKSIAKPVQNAVSSSIPASPPTSGVHKRGGGVSGFAPRVIPGRLTWGANAQNGNIRPKTVKFSYRPSRRMTGNRKGYMSLASLEVPNAAVVMADMAGKSNKYTNRRPMTREYAYSGTPSGKRKHKINGQGIAMIRALKRRPSRFVYPAAERAMPLAVNEASKVVRRYADIVNNNMRTR
jgi:hypothetical protein